MEHKRERAMASAAMHEYSRASHFAASARIDLLAAARLVEDAAGALDATIECFEDVAPSYAAAATIAGGWRSGCGRSRPSGGNLEVVESTSQQAVLMTGELDAANLSLG